MTQTVILASRQQRELAKHLIDMAPPGSVAKVSAPRRTLSQNDRMWAMLSDISRAKPGGRCHTPEVWKALAMHACGHAVQFEIGLNGEPFPIGFRSSRLSKEQMTDLIEFLFAFGAEHGVEWSDPAIAGEREAA